MPTLHVIGGPVKGQYIDIKRDIVFVGRSSKCDIQINDGTVSRMQLKISKIANTFFVEDLRSTNGTLINGEHIAPGEGYEVNEYDTISIGDSVFRIKDIHSHKAFAVKDSEPAPVEEQQYIKSNLSGERRSPSPTNLLLVCKVMELLRQSLDINDILEKTVEYLLEILPRIDRAAVLLFDDLRKQIKEVIPGSRQGQVNGDIFYSNVVVNQVLRNGKAVNISDPSDEEPSDIVEHMDTLKIKSVLCVPMITNLRTRGAIYLDSLRGPRGFRDEDILLLKSLSGPAAVAIENAHLASKLN
jgi:sigma-B regulation protein RsbU (phosphoserine phosphatase)